MRSLRATPRNSVTAPLLAVGSVTTRALAPGSVLSGTVADGSLGAVDLAPNAVSGDKLADNAIGTTKLRPNAVTGPKLADSSVDGGKVLDRSLSARDIARFSGTFVLKEFTILPATCQEATVAGTPADVANADISGDLVLVGAGADWPRRLPYGVTPAPGAPDQFVAYACNPTLVAISVPEVTFRYVVLGL